MSIPSAAPSKIPFADIPRFTKSILPLILLFGSALVLLVLLIKDVRRSWKRNTHWIPGKRFFLGALVLQLLGSLQYPIVSISDERKLEPAVVNELLQMIQKNRVLLLGPRVILSVVIGIILPQVASSRARNQKSDMWALVISAFSIVVHIKYESYIIESKYLIQGHHKPIYWLLYYPNDWTYKANLILTVSNCALLSFLCFVAVARKRIRKLVAHKIPLLSNLPNRYNASWQEVKEQTVKSWITARTSQPQYIIARSVLSSSTSFIVTLSVGIYIVEFVKNPRLPDLHYMIILISQCSVIFSGWLIVCQRCITAVVYYPRRVKDLRTYFRLEDFWTRHSPEYGKPKGLVKTMVQKCLVKTKAQQFLVKTMAYFVVILSKICWLITQFILSPAMVRLIMPMDHDDNIDKFSPAIMNMPGEDRVRLWVANRKSFQEAHNLLEEGESYAKKCTALISLLKAKSCIVLRYTDPSALEAESGFYVGKRTAKITVVSLLTILIEVFASDGGSVCPSTDRRTVSECINGCTQAWEIMEFVDNKDPGAALVNKEADRLFDSLTKSYMWLGLTLPTNNSVSTTVEEATARVEKLAQDKEDSWPTARNSDDNDSMNWTALIAMHYLKMVCESIRKCPADNMQKMLDAIQSSLADVIGDSVVRLKERIIVECRLVAEADMEKEEEKLWKVFELAGMAKEILRAAEENVWQDFL